MITKLYDAFIVIMNVMNRDLIKSCLILGFKWPKRSAELQQFLIWYRAMPIKNNKKHVLNLDLQESKLPGSKTAGATLWESEELALRCDVCPTPSHVFL